PNLKTFGKVVGALFCITLLVSSITGGNMFQAWNVADITYTYHEVPQVFTGVILAVLVGLVIIGGIKRIGSVAGRIVPLMCAIYIVAAVAVLIANIAEVPHMIVLIFKSGLPSQLGGEAPNATGAFLGGTFGYAAMWGIKRALFSSEAGQGSSPIAHSAAKTDEPVREGVVAGLEPFIDTIVVCTLTALVILSSGAYNRDSEADFVLPGDIRIIQATDANDAPIEHTWTLETSFLPDMKPDSRKTRQTPQGQAGWRSGETVFVVVEADVDTNTGRDLRKITGSVSRNDADMWVVRWNTLYSESTPKLRPAANGETDRGIYGDYAGASMTAYAFDRTFPGLGKWVVTIAAWLFAISTMISWSYYGEQGIYFFFGTHGEKNAKPAVMLYKIVYCALILLTCVAMMPIVTASDGSKRALIGTDAELDMWTTLGLGVMLVANIPIMLIFGSIAMKHYHEYMGKLKRGEMESHDAPPITDVVEGHDHD
ncbi:MAG: alanine:cation symporter family protein, partial [Phycisphaerales bacterium]|nr:alanine:cation symporter family protein [Phycisphaerales bacterium]